MSGPLTRLRVASAQADSSETKSVRQLRRAYFSPDLIRTHKIVAGDWVVLQGQAAVVAVQAWPRVGLEDDAVIVSATHQANSSSESVELHRFASADHSHGRAKTIKLRRCDVASPSGPSSSRNNPRSVESRDGEWTKAAIREVLSAMNFIRQGMTISIGDSAKATQTFEITSIEPLSVSKEKTSLGRSVAGLSLASIDSALYEMTWKAEIVLDESTKAGGIEGGSTSEEQSAPQPLPEGPLPPYVNLFTPSQPPTAAYGLLGGLRPQIEQIRALPGRFDREIEIGIPDASGRRQIIEIMLSKMPHSLTAEDVSAIASRTHGYVGADLSSLIRESASAAIQRWHLNDPPPGSTPTLTNDDVLAILPTVRPSAMREIFVETPTVKWSDIGGQEEVKQKLKECVEWPLTHRDTFTRLGVQAPRGVLLYGPPGCSKTMTAKALATESGINFIAVKGPELLNKYVGESERAVREIFRKARAASPSIIFFDEIDALGSARSDDHTHDGVLTSLLNEMDGVEELSGVTVVAATNRPDVLDSALMRPGRLDRILYVGAPDLAARKEIFRIRLANMAVEPNVDVEDLARIAEGCSGAEVASICQDAALAAMNEDLNAPYVKRAHLIHSALTVRRRITPDMIRFFEKWRDQSGVRSA
ncbi:hypothetical protein IAU60_006606 [Kwoniella sp. DSM 27419]